MCTNFNLSSWFLPLETTYPIYPNSPKRERNVYHANPRKQRAYQRVVLAIYRLADGEGLFCRATNMEIAVEASLGIDAVRLHIHELERSGDLTTFSIAGTKSNRRDMILMDHPAAAKKVFLLLRAGRCLGRHSAIARGVFGDGSRLLVERQMESF